jgi:hypothetical protein
MANRKIPELPELTSVANDDLFYVVDISDTSESAQGTSKKVKKSNLTPTLAQVTAVGNTTTEDITVGGLINITAGNTIGDTIQISNETGDELVVNNFIQADGFKVLTGLSTEFLKADGSIDTNAYVVENTPIAGATKTKITYDAKGLVTAGSDATTADIADSTDKRYVTDANLTVIGNTSGTNTGDNATNTTSDTYADAKVSDTAYDDTSWNGVTGIAPSKNAVRDKIESLAIVTKQYNTYFINTATGNNATGVFEDATKPFATIDYVLGLIGANNNVRIYLQNNGTFALNGTIPDSKTIEFYSETSSTITFASNTTVGAITTNSFLNFNIPKGTILFTSNGSGTADTSWFTLNTGRLNIKCSYLTVGANFYINRLGALQLYVEDTLTISGSFIYWLWLTQTAPFNSANIYIRNISSTVVSSLFSFALTAEQTQVNISIDKIVSTSTFAIIPTVSGIVNLEIGNIITTATGTSSALIIGGSNTFVNFKNTVLTGLNNLSGSSIFSGICTINSNTGGIWGVSGSPTLKDLILNYNGIASAGLFRYDLSSRVIISNTIITISSSTDYFAYMNGGVDLDFTGNPAIFKFYGACEIKHVTNNFELVYLKAGSNYPLFEVYGNLNTNGLMKSNPSTTMIINSITSNSYGLMTLPSVTNALISADATGKAIATKEFVEAKQIQRLSQYTVATLPTGAQGDLCYVTDALLPTYLGIAVGGGAVVCKVFFNGTNWIT